MLYLSGFELHSRWVPLSRAACDRVKDHVQPPCTTNWARDLTEDWASSVLKPEEHETSVAPRLLYGKKPRDIAASIGPSLF